jgi:hypothetical protein
MRGRPVGLGMPTESAQSWIKDYIPLATAFAALAVALFQYITTRPKLKLEIQKLRKEIDNLSEDQKTTSESLSEVQKALSEQIPIYPNEQIVYQNLSGSIGHDFRGNGGKIYEGTTPISDTGRGTLSFLDPGIINIDRENKEGRYEIYLRSYMVGAQKREVITKDASADPKRFRVSCEARAISGEHTLRFVLRDRQKQNWIGRSVTHRISAPEWKRADAYFTFPPGIEGEIRIDDENVSEAPSTVQIRKLVMTELKSD